MDALFIRNNKLKLLLTPFILIGIIVISMALTVIFQYRTITDISNMPLERMIIGFIESLLLVFFYNYAIRKLNVKYPWKRNWLIRSLLDFALAIFIPVLIISIMNLGLSKGWIPNHHKDEEFKVFIFIMPLMISALLLVVVEMIIASEERTQLEVKLAHIEKEQINSKYTALKEQLDHHFLFNNLSVLSSLIYESTEKADRFIQDFAAIYRYVLSINKQDLVTVEEELEFIKTYLNLYKFRFEDGFEYTVELDDESKQYLLPPLSLQVLVENVFKHNIVSSNKPLRLSIKAVDNTLTITNNIQHKHDRQASTNTGQANLLEKYKLLNSDIPVFKVENDQYISQIPMIKPAHD
ncbi:sensor histidine kinase [Carboxylicivirga sp. M1479]|uniref:sensor histidine kinase n=1 Tax=Carboxylicivirga sp. M1479 TaxID=2594476 RepID=UPI001177C2E4|nr:histidine kinase [Carboxylicivirga sp. M1479]TRX71549.1 hypothetical protein FNN09_06140 [Carboxylicivirga sp. M1479]